MQINCLGTLLGTILPAFVPRCHRYVEEGCRILPTAVNDKFMIVSPDGLVKCVDHCDGNCVNLLQLPIGPMALEMKCPYTPIHNKEMLPVQYKCPEYYICQVMSEMKATNSNTCLFASCSPESVAMSYIDFSANLWCKIGNLAMNFYSLGTQKMPERLLSDSQKLKKSLHDYALDNSIIAVEVPTIECIDTKIFESIEHPSNPMYRFRATYQETEYNEENLQQKIINCCNSTMVCIREAHDLCRRKATEVLLFVATDTDREYSKDKPNAIPVAYALKGKSLKVSTLRQMMNDVCNTMKDNAIDILVEAYDGQWSGLVFRDQSNKPLTLFEVQRDCWIEYSGMSKDKLLSSIRKISMTCPADINTCTSTVISRPGKTRIGNIEVKAAIHTKATQDPKHVMHCKRYLEVKSFCNEFNIVSGMAGLIFPNVERRPDLWQVNICDRNLLHMWGKRKLCKRFTQTSNVATSGESSNLLDQIEDDVMDIDMHETDSILDNVSENFSVTDSGHIRNLLLTSHNKILMEILFFLLCGKRTCKWSSFDAQELYDTVFRSSKDIFTQLTIHEIDGILKILE